MEYSPESIARLIFSSTAKEKCSCQLFSDNDINCIDLFEILLTIFMEGLEHFCTDLSKFNINDLTLDNLNYLNPWFESIGFTIKTYEYSINDKESYDEHYCKILIRDKLYNVFFVMKSLNKNYHFLLNGDKLAYNKTKNNICDLYSIFVNNNIVFKIKFERCFNDQPMNMVL